MKAEPLMPVEFSSKGRVFHVTLMEDGELRVMTVGKRMGSLVVKPSSDNAITITSETRWVSRSEKQSCAHEFVDVDNFLRCKHCDKPYDPTE